MNIKSRYTEEELKARMNDPRFNPVRFGLIWHDGKWRAHLPWNVIQTCVKIDWTCDGLHRHRPQSHRAVYCLAFVAAAKEWASAYYDIPIDKDEYHQYSDSLEDITPPDGF